MNTPPEKAWETHGEPFPVVGMGDMLPVQVPDPGGVVGSLPEGEGGAHTDATPISYGWRGYRWFGRNNPGVVAGKGNLVVGT